MTLEASAEEVPPPAPRGKRAKRSVNDAETLVPAAAAPPEPPAPPETPDEVLVGTEGNPEVNRRLNELRGIEDDDGPPQAQRRQPAPTDFDTDRTFVEPDSGDALNPFTRSPVEPNESRKDQREQRREDRQSTQQPTPSTKRFGAIGKKMPGAERIRVHKRLDNGKLAFVGDYDSADLAASDNVESFIFDSVTPKWGYGRYQIQGVDVHGRTFDAGRVEILAPLSEQAQPQAPAAPNPFDLLKQLMDREAERRDMELQLMQRNQKDPIDMIKQLHDLQQQMAPPVPMPVLTKQSDGGNNAMTTMLAGMMQMMTTVLATALAPKPERSDPMTPVLVALISKLADNKPANVDPTTQLTALSEVVKNLRGNDGGSGQMVDLLLKERMTPTDVLQMVDKFRGERGTDDFKKSLENIGFLLNAVQQVRAQTEPSASGGFLDVISSALNNPAFGEMLLSRTRGGQQQRQAPVPQQLPPPQQPMRALPDPAVVAKARELALRELRLKELELARREQALAGGAGEAAPVSAVAVEVPSAPSQEVPAGPIAAGLPPNIENYINAYLEAKDDSDIVRITFAMIFEMTSDATWKSYSEIVLTLIEQSDRARFMHYMASLFSSLKGMKVISEELGRRVLDSLHRNFEVLVQFTRESVQKLIEQHQAQGGAAGDVVEDEPGEGDAEEEDEEEDEDEDAEDPDDLLHLE
jgi:hypothetical protein